MGTRRGCRLRIWCDVGEGAVFKEAFLEEMMCKLSTKASVEHIQRWAERRSDREVSWEAQPWSAWQTSRGRRERNGSWDFEQAVVSEEQSSCRIVVDPVSLIKEFGPHPVGMGRHRGEAAPTSPLVNHNDYRVEVIGGGEEGSRGASWRLEGILRVQGTLGGVWIQDTLKNWRFTGSGDEEVEIKDDSEVCSLRNGLEEGMIYYWESLRGWGKWTLSSGWGSSICGTFMGGQPAHPEVKGKKTGLGCI